MSSATRRSAVTGADVLEWTGTPETRTVPFRPMDTPGRTVRRPAAYLVPPAWREVIERLTAHGIRTEVLNEPQTLEVEMYRLPDAKPSAAGFEGRVMVEAGTPVLERRRVAAPRPRRDARRRHRRSSSTSRSSSRPSRGRRGSLGPG